MLFPNLHFLYIQASFGCISNCSFCSKKSKKNIEINEKIIKNNINLIKERRFFSENLFIYNRELTSFSENFNKYINNLGDSFRNIYFHTTFFDISYNYAKYKGNKCVYQRDIDSLLEQKYFCNLIDGYFSYLPETIFVLWYDDKKSFYVIMKFLNNKFYDYNFSREPNGGYSLKIGNKVFKILPKKGERKNLQQCFFKSSISFLKEQIIIDNYLFPSSGFEITIKGDIRIHELPCGIGNLIVSSIHKTDIEIKKDFENFAQYIGEFLIRYKGMTQSSICKECNNISYKYE